MADSTRSAPGATSSPAAARNSGPTDQEVFDQAMALAAEFPNVTADQAGQWAEAVVGGVLTDAEHVALLEKGNLQDPTLAPASPQAVRQDPADPSLIRTSRIRGRQQTWQSSTYRCVSP